MGTARGEDGWVACGCGRWYWGVAGDRPECWLCRKVRLGEPLLPWEERVVAREARQMRLPGTGS